MRVDPRDGKTMLAAARTGHLGPTVFRSQDNGRTWSTPLYSSSRPSPPSDMLAPADRTFDAKQPPDVATWRQILASTQPPS